MKDRNWGILLAVGLVVAQVTVVGAFALLPATTSAANNVVAAVEPGGQATGQPALADQAAQVQQTFSQRERVYQQQIDLVNQLLQERQATYQAQIDELTQRVQSGQAQVNNLAAQEQAFQQQLAQLQAARNERQAMYQSQLAGAQSEYNARFAQYTAQLQEAQAKLAEANALLGR